MFGRSSELRHVRRLLASNPVVALLGPRQIGKTTLAREVARTWTGPTTVFDLEDPRDLGGSPSRPRRCGPGAASSSSTRSSGGPICSPCSGSWPIGTAAPARFLVLGSASPGLLRQSSDSLAGGIAIVEPAGVRPSEVGPRARRLWLRGGFPRAFLARSDADSLRWRHELVRTYLERDLPGLGVSLPARTLHRFWSMLAHYHGQVWNAAELARSLAVSESTVRRYLDLLAGTFMLRHLQPWTRISASGR